MEFLMEPCKATVTGRVDRRLSRPPLRSASRISQPHLISTSSRWHTSLHVYPSRR
jgi:hypothetical protein